MATKTKPAASLLEQIKKAVENFKRLQSSYGKYGAGDTEPDGAFHHILAYAFKGKPVDTDLSADEWQLYSDVKGAGLAAHNLNRAVGKVVELLKQVTTQDRQAVRAYLAGECWRADFGDD